MTVATFDLWHLGGMGLIIVLGLAGVWQALRIGALMREIAYLESMLTLQAREGLNRERELADDRLQYNNHPQYGPPVQLSSKRPNPFREGDK